QRREQRRATSIHPSAADDSGGKIYDLASIHLPIPSNTVVYFILPFEADFHSQNSFPGVRRPSASSRRLSRFADRRQRQIYNTSSFSPVVYTRFLNLKSCSLQNCKQDKSFHTYLGCLGALDGMMVSVRPTLATQAKYRNRKGQTAINVLGVVNQRMQFVYCLSGWPGSAHDSRILRDAMARDNSFRVPVGNYYLCDAGYTNARGFLTPFRGQRYHLTEWNGSRRPRSREEMYNMRHSKARNVVECAFGVLKMRWALLRDSSWFSPSRVAMIVNACCLLHNFIRRHGGADVFESVYTPEIPTDGMETPAVGLVSSVEASDEWTQFHQLTMAGASKSSARPRVYRSWSTAEERAVMDIFTKLYEEGVIIDGSMNGRGFSEAERRLKVAVPTTQHTADTIQTKFRNFKGKFQAQLELMNASGMGWDDAKGCCVCDKDIFAGWVKSHKLAAGLNNCRLPFWDELCKIFEVSRADGTEGMTPADAASRLEAELRATDSAPDPVSDNYGAETAPMMEDLINQGFDMRAEGLKDMEEDGTATSVDKKDKSTSGSKRSRQSMTDDYLCALKDQMGKFQESITNTASNIERLTNSWCLPEDVISRRESLVDEVNRLDGITYKQSLKAIRMLMKDPADLETFFKMPSDEMKVDFILSMLE
ncbi:Putative nuclease HARBI1, partial [Linum perenne]